MKYKHIKTGKIVDFKSIINDRSWELVPNSESKPIKKSTAKKSKKEAEK